MGLNSAPSLPLPQSRSVKKGGGGEVVDRFPVTYCSLKGSDLKVDPGLKENFVSSVMSSPKSLVAYLPTRR